MECNFAPKEHSLCQCVVCLHVVSCEDCRCKRNCDGPTSAAALVEPPPPTPGPGTELKKLLAKVGITATPDCSCNARAAEMDRQEQQTPGWCEANLDTIVGWLREQAEARGLPFLDLAGRMLVRRAIANARRNA